MVSVLCTEELNDVHLFNCIHKLPTIAFLCHWVFIFYHTCTTWRWILVKIELNNTFSFWPILYKNNQRTKKKKLSNQSTIDQKCVVYWTYQMFSSHTYIAKIVLKIHLTCKTFYQDIVWFLRYWEIPNGLSNNITNYWVSCLQKLTKRPKSNYIFRFDCFCTKKFR